MRGAVSKSVAALLLVCAAADQAGAAGARLRWRPSADASAVGYDVYVRAAGTPYGTPLDAGLPPLDSDGTMSFVVSGLTSGDTYYFAVTAYAADRTQSGFAGELALGPPTPCRIDRCTTPTACEFGNSPDGTPCSQGSICDACRAGSCAAVPTIPLTATMVRLSGRGRAPRLAASGSFTPPQPLDPTRSGVALTLADASGHVLYLAPVPGAAMRGNATGTSFRLDAGAAAASAPGLRQLQIRLAAGVARVSALAAASDLAAAVGLAELSLAVGFGGGQCALAAQLACSSSTNASACQ